MKTSASVAEHGFSNLPAAILVGGSRPDSTLGRLGGSCLSVRKCPKRRNSRPLTQSCHRQPLLCSRELTVRLTKNHRAGPPNHGLNRLPAISDTGQTCDRKFLYYRERQTRNLPEARREMGNAKLTPRSRGNLNSRSLGKVRSPVAHMMMWPAE